MGVRVGNSKIRNITVEDADNILPPLESTPWVRNPDWIDMPDIPTGESKAAFLFAVSPILQNRVGLRAEDNYFVDLSSTINRCPGCKYFFLLVHDFQFID